MSEEKTINRVRQLDPAHATGKAKQLFESVEHRLGRVPNLLRVLGNAPAALEGYLNFGAALAAGTLDAKVREQSSLAVAATNLCAYCLSAHTFMAHKLGLTESDVEDAIRAGAAVAKSDAILKLARSNVVQRGEVSDADLERARAAGLTDAEIVETEANVVLNIFTNYINHMARTVVDFPLVKSSAE